MASRGGRKQDEVLYPNRVRLVRRARGLTAQQLAERIGAAHQTVSKLERGETRLQGERMAAISRALGCEPAELLAATTTPRVPVIGRVGDGGRVHWLGNYLPSSGARLVACPRGLDPDHTEAIEILGDALFPLGEGWFVFFSRGEGESTTDQLGRLCVVTVPDPLSGSATFVRQLWRGSMPNRYHLLASNSAPIADAEVISAMRIHAIMAPTLVNEGDEGLVAA